MRHHSHEMRFGLDAGGISAYSTSGFTGSYQGWHLGVVGQVSPP